MDKLVIPKGEILHYGGMPVKLPEDTTVLGNRANFEMASAESKQVRQSKNHGGWRNWLCR